jgi:hypothetical protein
MAHMGTGNGVDDAGGRVDTDEQMSYIKTNARPNFVFASYTDRLFVFILSGTIKRFSPSTSIF